MSEKNRCPTCGSDDPASRGTFRLWQPALYGINLPPGTELTCVNDVWHGESPQDAT